MIEETGAEEPTWKDAPEIGASVYAFVCFMVGFVIVTLTILGLAWDGWRWLLRQIF